MADDEPRYTLAEAQKMLHHLCGSFEYKWYFKPNEATGYLECGHCKGVWRMEPMMTDAPTDWGPYWVRAIGRI